MRFLFDYEETIFSLVEEADFYRMKVEKTEIEQEHVEEFMDKTVEWLSSNPDKGILIDFDGVRSVCPDFTVILNKYYQDIKARGLHVRFVNVDPLIEPYIDVSNITVVMSIPEKPVLSAKALLLDLSEGLTDRDLMRKYGLSRKGMASMYKKMLAKGLVSRRMLAKRWGIAPREITIALEQRSHKASVEAVAVLKDLAAGVSDAALMEKYKLTQKGLQSLMRKLYKKGLVSKETLLKRRHSLAE
jgi:anti-anti-sigma regulatory factor/lambda repressor-like predicted transcriptional regulator